MQEWINKNNGCWKCCCINIGHKTDKCPNNFPDTATYHGITLADGVTLAAGAPSSNTVASVTINNTFIATEPVTVIASSLPTPFLPATNESSVIDAGDLSVDSDADVSANRSTLLPPTFRVCALSSDPPSQIPVPFAMEHLRWHCLIQDKAYLPLIHSSILTLLLMMDLI